MKSAFCGMLLGVFMFSSIVFADAAHPYSRQQVYQKPGSVIHHHHHHVAR